MRAIFLASMLLLISGTANAAGPAPAATQLPTTGQQQATRIETDQKTGVIRFIVDGQEVARFERDGLHLRKNAAINLPGVTGVPAPRSNFPSSTSIDKDKTTAK